MIIALGRDEERCQWLYKTTDGILSAAAAAAAASKGSS